MNNLSRFEPITIFIWGLLVTLLIANGYLLPQQKDLWVNGGLELISAFGSVSLISIYLHHTLTKKNQEQISSNIQQLVNNINNSPVNGKASIPVTNPRDTIIHVNVP